MSDGVISLEWIGARLRAIQAEQRTVRMENELFRAELARVNGAMATREMLGEVLRVLVDRIGNFEALFEARLDHATALFDARFNQATAQFDARFNQVVDQFDGRFNQLAAQLDRVEQRSGSQQ